MGGITRIYRLYPCPILEDNVHSLEEGEILWDECVKESSKDENPQSPTS